MKENSCLKLMRVNLWHHAFVPLVTAFGVFILTASLFNLSALTAREAARPLEFFLCFMGVMLFAPVFYPEQNHDLRDVICSKKTSYLTVCALRLLYSFVVLTVLELAFVCIMKLNESEVTDAHLFGGIATAVFLGAIGFCVAGITDNTTLGYMASMLYYLVSYGAKDKLGKFFLFDMSRGNFEEKGWLFLGAAVLFMATFSTMFFRRKRLGY